MATRKKEIEMVKKKDRTFKKKSPVISMKPLSKTAREVVMSKKDVLKKITDRDVKKLFHEIQVHQAELEIQNEQLHAARQELEESRSRYVDLYDFAPIGYFSFDESGAILEANLTGCRLLGIARSRLIKRPFILHVHNEDKQIFFSHIKKVFESGTRQTCELRLKKKRSFFYARLESFSVDDNTGKYSSCRTAISDISDRKRAEEESKRLSLFLQKLIDAIPAPVFYKDSRGIYLRCNTAFQEYLGLKKDQIIGRTVYDVAPKDLAGIYEQKDKDLFETKGKQIYESSVKHSDGTKHDVIFFKETFLNEDSSLGGLVGVILDITERKQVELQLKEVAEKYSSLFNTTSDGVWIHNLNGEILEVNDAYCRMSGYSRDELTHMPISKLEAVETPEEIANHIRKIIETGGHDRFESRHRRKDGSIFDVDITALYFEKEGGRIAIFVRDITERKRSEARIIRLTRLYAVLSRVNEAIVRTHDEETLLKDVCKIVAEEGGFPLVWIGQIRERQVAPVAWSGPSAGYLREIKVEVNGELGNGPTGACIREDYPVLNGDFDTNLLTAPWREPALRYGFKASAAFPLHRQGKVIGTLTIYSAEPAIFDQEQISLLQTLSVDISYALDALKQERLRTEAEQALKTGEERYRSLVEMSPDALFINRFNRIVFVNPAAMQLFGATNAKQILGKSPFEFFDPSYHQIMTTRIAKLLDGESIPLIEGRIIRLDGTIRDVEVVAAPFDDSEGRAIQVVLRDVTGRKHAEEALRKSEERFKLLSETATRLLATDDPQEIVNELCRKVMNHLDCHAFFNYLFDEKKQRLHLNAYAGIPSRTADEIEWLDYGDAVCGCVARDGQRIIAENIPETCDPRTDLVRSFGIKAYACHPLMAQGRVIGTLSFGTKTRSFFNSDEIELMKTITDQVAVAMEKIRILEGLELRVQERTIELAGANTELQNKINDLNLAKNILIEQSAQLEAFFKHSITPLVFLDRDFNFIRVNEAYAKCCRRNISEFYGQNHFEFYPHEENEAIFRHVVDTKETYHAIAKPFVFPDHPEWGVTYWDWKLTPLLDNKGEVQLLVFALEDVTERKEADEKLKVYSNQRAIIAELGQIALAEADLYVLMNKAVALVAQTLDVEYCKVLELLPDGRNLLLRAGVGWKDGLIGKATVSSGKESQAGYTLLSEEPVIVEDLRTETRFSGPPLLHDHHVVSGMSVIIQGREGIFGVLGAHSNRQRAFTQGDIQFLRAVANVLATAIERKQADEELLKSESKYRLLVEQASDGIALLDRQLNFIDVNPMACQMSGYSREEILRLNAGDLIPPEELAVNPLPLDKILAGRTVVFEGKFIRKDGTAIDAEVSARMLDDGRIQAISRDITERKEEEKRRLYTSALLELFTRTSTRKEYIDSVVQALHEWSGCCCIGIRVTDDEGYIPYESYMGFSHDFYKLENMLSLKRDACACIRVITGKHEVQDAGALTPYGSFRLNNSIDFLNSLTDEEKARFRGNCIRYGFLSIAIVPIRYRGQTLGAIHLADQREGMFTSKIIQFIEEMAPLIGEAVHRFNTEDELRRSEASLSRAQQIGHIGNWDWNISTGEFRWSDEIYRIFGLTPQQFGSTYDAFLNSIHPDDRKFVEYTVNNALRNKQPYNINHRVILPDGEIRIVHELGEILYNSDGMPVRMYGTIQDVTEQKMVEEELRLSRERLRDLFTHLQSVREEERTNIAREIHDEFGTILTALKIDLSWLEKKLPGDQTALIERLKKDLELTQSAIKTVQRISTELRPGILDHLGLGSAIEWQVKEFGNRTEIDYDISIDMENSIMDRNLSTAVFRILQETLTNIARHAEATKVSVNLKEKNNLLILEVTDNGRGITDEHLSDPHSFGLMGMRERAQQFGGDVRIMGTLNKGTTVTVKIPLKGMEA